MAAAALTLHTTPSSLLGLAGSLGGLAVDLRVTRLLLEAEQPERDEDAADAPAGDPAALAAGRAELLARLEE